ncbi:MAG: 1-acyl-sn-glycerol-3-phosphate acyltransferase [Deltaproteobacteria bacterium]|nr:1-acyl-sn-glycerol-3-phosphate acyltransferase [Deltaproteobacteria bacterium]
MALRDTIDWARNEWGILAKGGQMSLDERVRWLRQWVPMGARTVGYGTISLTLGPLTPEHSASLWAMKQWSRACIEGLKIEAECHGGEQVPEGGFMFASNHQSLLDILVLGATLPGDFKWAAKRSLMKVPFLGWHLRLAGHVPVDRESGKRAAADVIKRFEAVLSAGKPLLVFPEGTRSEDGTVKDFKSGGFYAAVRANRPVVPVALDGAAELMSKGAVDTGSWKKGERRVVVMIGKPIAPKADGTEKARVEALRDDVRRAVVELHRQARERRSDS